MDWKYVFVHDDVPFTFNNTIVDASWQTVENWRTNHGNHQNVMVINLPDLMITRDEVSEGIYIFWRVP